MPKHDIRDIVANWSNLDLIQTLTTDSDDPINQAIKLELSNRASSAPDTL